MEPFEIIVAVVAFSVAGIVLAIVSTWNHTQVREAKDKLEEFSTATDGLKTRLDEQRNSQQLQGFLKMRKDLDGNVAAKKPRKRKGRRRSRRKRPKQ